MRDHQTWGMDHSGNSHGGTWSLWWDWHFPYAYWALNTRYLPHLYTCWIPPSQRASAPWPLISGCSNKFQTPRNGTSATEPEKKNSVEEPHQNSPGHQALSSRSCSASWATRKFKANQAAFLWLMHFWGLHCAEDRDAKKNKVFVDPNGSRSKCDHCLWYHCFWSSKRKSSMKHNRLHTKAYSRFWINSTVRKGCRKSLWKARCHLLRPAVHRVESVVILWNVISGKCFQQTRIKSSCIL